MATGYRSRRIGGTPAGAGLRAPTASAYAHSGIPGLSSAPTPRGRAGMRAHTVSASIHT